MTTLYDRIAPYLRTEPTTEFEGDTYRQICLATAKALGLGHITGKQHKWLQARIREGMWPFTIDLEEWLQAKDLLATLARHTCSPEPG